MSNTLNITQGTSVEKVMSDPIDPTPDPQPKDISGVMDILRTNISATLKDLGKNAGEAAQKLEFFLTQIEPEVQEAIVAGDMKSLDYIRDRVAARTGRVSLGLIYRERQLMVTTIMTVLRVLVQTGAVASL